MASNSTLSSKTGYSLVATIKNPKWPFHISKIKSKSLRYFSEKIFNRMEAYFKGELTTACAIYAPYRTGKSEFLYTCFRKTLNSGHLALYGNLEKYLKLVEDYDTEDFAEALEKIKESQIELISEIFINKEKKEHFSEILFPEIKNNSEESLDSFLSDFICNPSEISVEDFKKTLKKKELKIVILIDEMEETFEDLRKKYGKGTKVPLRSTYEVVNTSVPPFMTIMAYGMISVMESLRFDEAGRIFSESIPEIPPIDFNHEKLYKNFWWWLSRARWGWYNKFKAEIDLKLPFTRFLNKISNTVVDNISLFDFNHLQMRDDILSDNDIYDIMKKNLLEIFPHSINLMEDTKRNVYQFNYDHFYFSSELTNVNDVTRTLQEDINHIKGQNEKFKELYDNIPDITTLFLYMGYILEAISNNDSKICLGFITNKHMKFTKEQFIIEHFLLPLFQLIRDFIIEFQDDKYHRPLLECLEYLGELIKDPYHIENISNLFKQIDPRKGPRYCQISLKTLAKLYPQPLYEPIINLKCKLKSEELILLNLLRDKGSDVLYIYKKPEKYGLNIFYFLIEDVDDISHYYNTDCIQSKAFDKDSVFIFLINAKSNEVHKDIIAEIKSTFQIKSFKYLCEINKFSFIPFNEERLSQFIKSMFYETQNLFDNEEIENKKWTARKDYIIKEIDENGKLPQREKKKIRKSFNFFNDMFNFKLEDLTKDILVNYKTILEKDFKLGEKNTSKELMKHISEFLSGTTAGRAVNILQMLLLYSPKINENSSLYNKLKENWLLISDFLSFGTKDNAFNIFPNPNDLISDSPGYDRFLKNSISTSKNIKDTEKRNPVGLLKKIESFLSMSNNKDVFKNFQHLSNNFEFDDSIAELDSYNKDSMTKFINKLDNSMDFTKMLAFENSDGTERKWAHILELYYEINSIDIKKIRKTFQDELKNFETNVIKKFNTFFTNIKDKNDDLVVNKRNSIFFYHHDGFEYFKTCIDKIHKFFKNELGNLSANQPFYCWAILIFKRITPVIEKYVNELNNRLTIFYNNAKAPDGFHGKRNDLKNKLNKLKVNFLKDLKNDNLDLTEITLNKLEITDIQKKFKEDTDEIDSFISNELIKKVFIDEFGQKDASLYLKWWDTNNSDLSIEILVGKLGFQTPDTEIINKIELFENFLTKFNDLYNNAKTFVSKFKEISVKLENINKSFN